MYLLSQIDASYALKSAKKLKNVLFFISSKRSTCRPELVYDNFDTSSTEAVVILCTLRRHVRYVYTLFVRVYFTFLRMYLNVLEGIVVYLDTLHFVHWCTVVSFGIPHYY